MEMGKTNDFVVLDSGCVFKYLYACMCLFGSARKEGVSRASSKNEPDNNISLLCYLYSSNFKKECKRTLTAVQHNTMIWQL